MIEALARGAVDRLLTATIAAAADELPEDVTARRAGDGIVLTGPQVRRRALTDGRLTTLIATVAARR